MATASVITTDKTQGDEHARWRSSPSSTTATVRRDAFGWVNEHVDTDVAGAFQTWYKKCRTLLDANYPSFLLCLDSSRKCFTPSRMRNYLWPRRVSYHHPHWRYKPLHSRGTQSLWLLSVGVNEERQVSRLHILRAVTDSPTWSYSPPHLAAHMSVLTVPLSALTASGGQLTQVRDGVTADRFWGWACLVLWTLVIKLRL